MRRKELPKEISPNPLLSSVVEVRFESDLKPENLINLYLKHFSKDFPHLLDHNPESGIIQPFDSTYRVKYIMNNEDFSILFGNKIIAFENRGDYKFWSEYFPLIIKNLNRLNASCNIEKVERLGIRYLSFFEEKVISENSIIINNQFDFDNYLRKDSYFRSIYFKDNMTINIQVTQNVAIKKDDLSQTGTLIDIDIWCDKDLPQQINQNLFDIINLMHTEEKAMFFTLLSDEFLSTLKPQYHEH